MSATSAPFGFVPIYHPTGNARGTAYDGVISAAYATSIYKYQPVYINAGVLEPGDGSVDLLGVFAGVEYQESGTLRWVAIRRMGPTSRPMVPACRKQR